MTPRPKPAGHARRALPEPDQELVETCLAALQAQVDVQARETAFQGRFGIPIVETMGLTETAAQILSNPLPPAPRKIGSPGIAYGNEVAILSPDLTPCPVGEEGERAGCGDDVERLEAGSFEHGDVGVAHLFRTNGSPGAQHRLAD